MAIYLATFKYNDTNEIRSVYHVGRYNRATGDRYALFFYNDLEDAINTNNLLIGRGSRMVDENLVISVYKRSNTRTLLRLTDETETVVYYPIVRIYYVSYLFNDKNDYSYTFPERIINSGEDYRIAIDTKDFSEAKQWGEKSLDSGYEIGSKNDLLGAYVRTIQKHNLNIKNINIKEVTAPIISKENGKIDEPKKEMGFIEKYKVPIAIGAAIIAGYFLLKKK